MDFCVLLFLKLILDVYYLGKACLKLFEELTCAKKPSPIRGPPAGQEEEEQEELEGAGDMWQHHQHHNMWDIGKKIEKKYTEYSSDDRVFCVVFYSHFLGQRRIFP